LGQPLFLIKNMRVTCIIYKQGEKLVSMVNFVRTELLMYEIGLHSKDKEFSLWINRLPLLNG
jgi:hypothetical protein